MSYGGDFAQSHRRAGMYAGRILHGEKPSDLPVHLVTKIELFINVKAAEDPLFLVQSASPLGELVIYPLPAGVSGVSPKIEKRTPADLALGMAKSDKIPAAGDTMLYKITPSMELGMKDRVYSLAFTLPMGAKTRPVVSLLPESGKWTEQLPAGGGAALDNTYFTVAAKESADPLAQWAAAKAAASDAMIAAGATITHHHAVGTDHKPWFEREIGPVGVQTLRAIKASLDPAGILNPGVLIP